MDKEGLEKGLDNGCVAKEPKAKVGMAFQDIDRGGHRETGT